MKAALSTVLILLLCSQWGESNVRYLILSMIAIACTHYISIVISVVQPSRELLLTPYNIEFYATFLSSVAELIMNGRVIYFGPGPTEETLLEVPIGQIDPHATVVITVGLEPSHPNTPGVDSDPRVGIIDGTGENAFNILDVNNYNQFSPCQVNNGNDDDTRVTPGTLASATIKLTFSPFNKLGICETAQDGGYINTATFEEQIDITKPLFLNLRRGNANEVYYFHYFNVEIY